MMGRGPSNLVLGLAMLVQGCAGSIPGKEPAAIPTVTSSGPGRFEVQAGRVTGFLSLLVSGEGNVTARGQIRDGRPQPASFVSAVVREDELGELAKQSRLGGKFLATETCDGDGKQRDDELE